MREKTKQISIKLPVSWLSLIDSQVTAIKTRQDFIRETLEPTINKLAQGAKRGAN